jgi:hypothetical protein
MNIKFSEIVALILGTMLGLRMLFMLVAPKAHRPLAFSLYNQKRVGVKRIFYIGVSILCSFLLIRETSIVYFVLAAFAIGAIWDFYNTFFEFPSTADVEELLKAGKPIPFYLRAHPSRNVIQGLLITGLVAWLYAYIFFLK